MNLTSTSPEQEPTNELMLNASIEPIAFTVPLDRPAPRPQQSPGRPELESMDELVGDDHDWK